MKRLTIYTARYETQLKNFAGSTKNVNTLWSKWRDKNRLFGLCLTWGKDSNAYVTEQLVLLLQELAATENPVFKNSPKLLQMAKDLQSTESHGREVGRLKSFLRSNRSLNIEGYINFRMNEYRNSLDILSYKAMKKILK